MTAKLDFIDLKSQYAALKDRIAQRMQAVLDHGQYIMGPEVKSSRSAWPPSPARSTASPWPAAPRRC